MNLVLISLTDTVDGPVWLNLDQLEAFGLVDGETNVRTKSDLTIVVKETPDEILAKLDKLNDLDL